MMPSQLDSFLNTRTNEPLLKRAIRVNGYLETGLTALYVDRVISDPNLDHACIISGDVALISPLQEDVMAIQASGLEDTFTGDLRRYFENKSVNIKTNIPPNILREYTKTNSIVAIDRVNFSSLNARPPIGFGSFVLRNVQLLVTSVGMSSYDTIVTGGLFYASNGEGKQQHNVGHLLQNNYNTTDSDAWRHRANIQLEVATRIPKGAIIVPEKGTRPERTLFFPSLILPFSSACRENKDGQLVLPAKDPRAPAQIPEHDAHKARFGNLTHPL